MKSSFRTISLFEYFHYSDCQISFVMIFHMSILFNIPLQSSFHVPAKHLQNPSPWLLPPFSYFQLNQFQANSSLTASCLVFSFTPWIPFNFLFKLFPLLSFIWNLKTQCFSQMDWYTTLFTPRMLLPPSFNYFSFWNSYKLNNPFSFVLIHSPSSKTLC